MVKDDYKALVAQAEKAVDSVTDPALKQIAFQRVLDDLLQADRSPDKPNIKPTRPKAASGAKRSKGGPKSHVEDLIEEGFFKNRKTSTQVLEELANQGHHLSASDAGVALLRLCKAKRLRRKKEGKTYLYSNW
jgi:hypothetical protein